jgi:hypothetical protein
MNEVWRGICARGNGNYPPPGQPQPVCVDCLQPLVCVLSAESHSRTAIAHRPSPVVHRVKPGRRLRSSGSTGVVGLGFYLDRGRATGLVSAAGSLPPVISGVRLMVDGLITKVETISEGSPPQDSRWGHPLLVQGRSSAGWFSIEITREAAESL